MNDRFIIKPKQATRQDKLNGWLAERGIKKTHLADALGVTSTAIGSLLSGKNRTPARIQQLINLGIPAELLPEPQRHKSGPKPKVNQDHNDSESKTVTGGEG